MFKNNAADSQKVGLEPWLIYGFKSPLLGTFIWKRNM